MDVLFNAGVIIVWFLQCLAWAISGNLSAKDNDNGGVFLACVLVALILTAILAVT